MFRLEQIDKARQLGRTSARRQARRPVRGRAVAPVLDGAVRVMHVAAVVDDAWRELRGFIGRLEGVDGFETLEPGELGILGDILRTRSVSEISRARGVRRDSVDRRMSEIREKLGLENNRQLLSALAELRAAGPGRRDNPR